MSKVEEVEGTGHAGAAKEDGGVAKDSSTAFSPDGGGAVAIGSGDAAADFRVREKKALLATQLTREEEEDTELALSIRGGEYELTDGAGAADRAPWPAGLDEALRVAIPHAVPKTAWPKTEAAPRFYDWRQTFPFLAPMLDGFDTICDEVRRATRWHAWPEHALYNTDEGDDWKVFPFVHTFPATDPSATTWLPKNVAECPRTAALLASLPGLRTALVSRLGPGTSLTAHRGWAALANHVLRVHLPLVVPKLPHGDEPCCGLACEGAVQYHKERDFLVFDDSKLHMAFNDHPEASRVVLIFDLVRPKGLPLGLAAGSTTDELEAFIDYFSQ